MPDKLSQENVQKQCEKLLAAMNTPAFLIMGWKKKDGTTEAVQLFEDIDPVEYFKTVGWAINQVTENLE